MCAYVYIPGSLLFHWLCVSVWPNAAVPELLGFGNIISHLVKVPSTLTFLPYNVFGSIYSSSSFWDQLLKSHFKKTIPKGMLVGMTLTKIGWNNHTSRMNILTPTPRTSPCFSIVICHFVDRWNYIYPFLLLSRWIFTRVFKGWVWNFTFLL